jgi:hypothetical protein
MKTVIYQAPFSQTWNGLSLLADYVPVWTEENEGRTIDEIWTRFQRIGDGASWYGGMPPEGYTGRSLSIGDVVAIGDDFYTPEVVGWRKLTAKEADLVKFPFKREVVKRMYRLDPEGIRRGLDKDK